MMAYMFSNTKLNLIVTELFIKGGELNTFITKSYFTIPKNIMLKSTHYFIMKIRNKWELQQTAFKHSSDTVLTLKT